MTLPEMTEANAYLYMDIISMRFLGWEVVERMKHHPRSKAARAASEFFRDIVIAQPKFDDLLSAIMENQPVHMLWPEYFREEVERQINTKVPRTINEPTSTEFIASMHECGRTD